MFDFLRNAHIVYHIVYTIIHYISKIWGFQFLTSTLTLILFLFFFHSRHPTTCEMIPHLGSDCIFLIINDFKLLCICLWAISIFLGRKIYSNPNPIIYPFIIKLWEFFFTQSIIEMICKDFFSLYRISFSSQKFLILMKPNLNFLSLLMFLMLYH